MNRHCMTFKGGGTLASLIFNHNMNTTDVIVQVYEPDGESIEVGIVREKNHVALLFKEPPTVDVRVIVIG